MDSPCQVSNRFEAPLLHGMRRAFSFANEPYNALRFNTHPASDTAALNVKVALSQSVRTWHQ